MPLMSSVNNSISQESGWEFPLTSRNGLGYHFITKSGINIGDRTVIGAELIVIKSDGIETLKN